MMAVPIRSPTSAASPRSVSGRADPPSCEPASAAGPAASTATMLSAATARARSLIADFSLLRSAIGNLPEDSDNSEPYIRRQPESIAGQQPPAGSVVAARGPGCCRRKFRKLHEATVPVRGIYLQFHAISNMIGG